MQLILLANIKMPVQYSSRTAIITFNSITTNWVNWSRIRPNGNKDFHNRRRSEFAELAEILEQLIKIEVIEITVIMVVLGSY